MGYSSYLCKHCDHGIMDAASTDEGINEWMSHAVMMAENGSRLIEPEYGGYSGEYERFINGGVWVHFACWEVAGKPEFDAYDGPSKHDPDQGGGSFRGNHDMIDPRIKDEDERARLLAAGIKLRDEKRYTHNAREVHEWMDKEDREYHRAKFNGEWFRFRYTYHHGYDEDGKGGHTKNMGEWAIYDALDREREEVIFKGTEDELKAHLSALWSAFLESDECAAYVAHREVEIVKYRAEELENLKAKGRFKTTYGPKRDEEGNELWPVHQVTDAFRYRTDTEWFHGDGPGVRAKTKAKLLNEAWAAAGYPEDFEHELFVKETYGDEDEDE